MEMQKVVRLPEKEDPHFAASIVRLHSSHIDARKKNRNKYFRREAVIIKNRETGQWIVRMVLGSKGISGLTRDALALDYDGIDALGYTQAVFAGEPVDLEITRANDWDVIRYYWNHPDIGYRTAHRITAISFGLGLIGLVLGVLTLFV